MTHRFNFLLLLLLSFQAVQSQNNFEQLDNYFDTIQKYQKAMGTVALAKDGKITYMRSFGFADLENKTPDNDSTEYRIGSISKTFTAVLILKTVDKNKLTIDQTIDKWFPSIPNAKLITVSDLLYHRSGIHNFTDDSTYLEWNTKPKSESELLSLIEKGGSDFAPGTKMAYSNSNYVLLSILLEKINQKTYEQLLNEEIIQPLQLKRTYYGKKINTANNESYSYTFNGQGFEKSTETDMSIPRGAGAIVSTPSDLIKFINALFKGQLLTQKTFELMTTPKDNFGMGLFKVPFGNKTGWGHTGGVDGFRSVFSYFPSDSISYALCTNGAAINPNDISIAVLSAANGLEVTLPDFSSGFLSPDQLVKYTGTYVSKDLPLKITVSVKEGNLIAQATGQSSFILTAKGEDKFVFDAAGLTMEFKPAANEMTLIQGGKTFAFKKE